MIPFPFQAGQLGFESPQPAGGGTLLLDLYSIGVGVAYSVRKLRTAYGGSCLRVRRSSDNAEQDIGFSGIDLDTTSLLAFVGAGSGFVTTWYDQSGNGINCTQSTTGSQPRIVNSGATDTENSKPIVVFDGTDDALFSGFSTSVVASTRRLTAAVVERSQRTSSGNEAFVAFKKTGQRDYTTGFIFERRTTNISAGLNNGDASNNYIGRQGADSNTSALSVAHYFITPQTPAESMWIDGTSKTLSNAYQLGTGSVANHQVSGSGSTRVILGNGQQNTSDSTFDRPFQGKLAEVIVWPDDLTANRSAIALDQKTYFGTP